jgi:GT2 family glycosyltransferase
MRIVVSDAGVALEGWIEVARAGRLRSGVRSGAIELLETRADDIDELLIIGSLERSEPEYAEALLAATRRLHEGTPVTLVVPDAASAFGALDAGDARDADLTEWYDAVFGPDVDPWCTGPADVAGLAARAGVASLELVEMPAELPPGLTGWRVALRVGSTTGQPVPQTDSVDEVHRRLRRLAHARHVDHGGGPPAIDAPSAPRSRARALLDRYLPRGGKRRALARASVEALRETQDYVDRVQQIATQSGLHEPRVPSYRTWSKTHDATSDELADQRALSQSTRDPVTVHCVVMSTGSLTGVSTTLESLREQSWAHWRATVVGRGGGWLRSDARVTFRRADARDPATLVNAALADPDLRSLVVFLDAGDRLAPDACFRIADTVATDPLIDLVYWDDDVVSGGRRLDPRFRPSWSPETLLGANYLGRSFAIRRRVAMGLAGLTEGLGDDTWWDLLLRADLTAERVARVPRVLSHLRRRPEPIGTRGVDVVAKHLERVGVPARAVASRGCVKVSWDLPDWPHVTIIVPTRHNRTLVTRALRGIERTDYPSLDVMVVDNGGRTDERASWYADAFRDLDLEVEWWDDVFNYSAVNNFAARQARGDVLVFVNDDCDFPDGGWLRELVGWASRPDIGVAGLQLVGADGTIQHGGVILGLNGFADHLFQGLAPASDSLLGPTTWYRNVLAVTAACLAVRRNLFEELGGFDERFRLCGSDVVLGLDAGIAGKRNVCSPFGGVRHLESATRAAYVPPEDFFASYWRYQR